MNLGLLIELLKLFDFKVAVFTNSSLLWRQDVKTDLSKADLVSIKIDTVDEETWWRINRPKSKLNLELVLDGINDFSRDFKSKIITETMLIKGINDSEYLIEETAEFISRLRVEKSYLAAPVRPPAENNVKPASLTTMDFALKTFGENNIDVESLTLDTAIDFSHTDNFEEELLSITSVHPMNRDAVSRLLKKSNLSWSVISKLLNQNKLIEVEYNGEKYYQRNFKYGNVI